MNTTKQYLEESLQSLEAQRVQLEQTIVIALKQRNRASAERLALKEVKVGIQEIKSRLKRIQECIVQPSINNGNTEDGDVDNGRFGLNNEDEVENAFKMRFLAEEGKVNSTHANVHGRTPRRSAQKYTVNNNRPMSAKSSLKSFKTPHASTGSRQRAKEYRDGESDDWLSSMDVIRPSHWKDWGTSLERAMNIVTSMEVSSARLPSSRSPPRYVSKQLKSKARSNAKRLKFVNRSSVKLADSRRIHRRNSATAVELNRRPMLVTRIDLRSARHTSDRTIRDAILYPPELDHHQLMSAREAEWNKALRTDITYKFYPIESVTMTSPRIYRRWRRRQSSGDSPVSLHQQ